MSRLSVFLCAAMVFAGAASHPGSPPLSAQTHAVIPSAAARAVTQMSLAQSLFWESLASGDALMAATAAQLLAQVNPRAAQGDLAGRRASDKPDALSVRPLATVQDALDLARRLAHGRQTILDLIAGIEDTAMRGVVEGPQEAQDFVPGKGERSYVATYKASEHALFMVKLNRDARIDFQVYDEYDRAICPDPVIVQGGADGKFISCEWFPAWKGAFRIVLRNAAAQDANVMIMTN